ncbi:type II toxin-antitoxin system RelE/ParE family toxin [Treponema sp. HNW]|uniref:type II toxin-antitoxin system RelE/ParE family toxin n=1 Tax=Treponema sp. HNW TaxID=3116654 RepID=UPI003D0B3FC2
MRIELSKRAIKDIAKCEKAVQNAVFKYLEKLETCSMTEIYAHGAKDLKGNLKGLIRFKDASFPDHLLVGTKRDNQIVIMLCCEPRNTVYKNKDKLAKHIRKGGS